MKKMLLLSVLLTFPLFAQYNSVWDQVPETIKKTNNFKRFEWFYRSRVNEQGNYPKEFINQQRIAEEQKLLERKSLNKPNTSDQWTAIGPFGIDMSSSFTPYWGVCSGRIRGLDIHPTDPNTVYIGAASGGIWKTTDGGTSWTDISSGLNRLTFGSIAIDPNNPDIVYAATGEAMWYYNTVTYEGDGLYKTTDGGSTWSQLTGIGTTTQFCDIEVSPHNSNLIIAGLGAGNWSLGRPSNTGIWRSSNGGSSWTKVVGAPGYLGQGFEVEFHPTDPNLVYCGIGNQYPMGGFLISTDAGLTWKQSNTGLPAPKSVGRIQFAISNSEPSTIYSVINNNSPLPGGQLTAAFKSTDGGANWAQISSGVLISGTYDGTNISDQGNYDLCIAVNPTNVNNVFFGNVELSKTMDGSTISFLRNTSGYSGGSGAWDGFTHIDIHKIVFSPSNPSILYVGCDGGVYKSTNGGTSFFAVNNGMNTIQFYRVASHPTNSNILFGGSQDNGNFSTSNKGATKWLFETSGDGMECFIDYNNSDNVFISNQNGRLFRSTNAGVSWTRIKYEIASNAWLVPYWQHPTNPAKLYAALGMQIYRSTNNGTTWSAISSSLGNIITSVAQSRVNSNNMMAALSQFTTTPGVFLSTDEGVTWTSITSKINDFGFYDAGIQRVVADPLNANTFYLTRTSYTMGQVIKTTDLGNTWTDISSNLPKVTTNDIFVDPAASGQIFAANDFGVYWSSNSGGSWTKLNNGMPFVPVHDFDFFSNGGTRYLRAATHGRGVYELNIDNPLPVELLEFTAIANDNNIQINWKTASEINNRGFELERSIDSREFIKIAFIRGNGNSSVENMYSYLDKYISGSLRYRLKQIDMNGNFAYSKTAEVSGNTVKDFLVYQNYPNPFNPVTLIKFRIPQTASVTVTISNILGEKIATIVNEVKSPGFYEYPFDGSNLTSGVYFYNVTMKGTGENSTAESKTYKMILAR